MKLIGSLEGLCYRALAALLVPAVIVVSMCEAPAYGQRVFGLDTSSAANFDVSQAQWNAAYNSGYAPAGIPSFQFAIVRSSHGGTNGVSPASEDPQFYQNITRATTAGMLAGSYHFPHADVYTAADDAQHYLNYAGMYMKPGFLLPVLDLEGSSNALSQAALTTWSIDFINTIFAAKGINPIVYTSSSFNTDEVTAAVAFTNIASSPHTGERTYQWLARPSGSILTGDPGAASGYPDPYGGWDPLYTTKSASTDPAVKPWAFWQNGNAHISPTDPSTGNPNPSGYQFLIDYDAANGNIEFVKDFLVPALWTNGGSGDWGTIANWNSDNPAYTGAIQNGPAPRLPAYDATNPTLGNRKYDWVKLQNAGGGTVTISSGAQGVRKFYTQQPLNITGGSLTVNYIPGSGGKWDLPSEFNAAVTLSGSASYSAHTTQVDGGGGVFNINGGTVTFSVIDLVSHASNSGKIVMGGDATFGQTGGAGTSIIRSTGNAVVAGSVNLGSANRTFTVNNGSAAIDLSIQAPVTGTGGLVKAGAGTLQLTNTNTYSGGTTLTSGTLLVTKDLQLGAAPGAVQPANITLNGGTLKSGSELISLGLSNVGSGYSSFPTVSFGGAGADAVAPSANVVGKISSIQVTAGGSAYTGTAKVVIVGGGGTGATATATMSSGAVTGITITNQGTGYTSVPTVYITDGSGQGVAGSGAAAVVNGIILTGMALNSSGFDYASPTVTLSGGGGTGAVATASSVTSLTLNSNRGVSLTANGGTLDQTAGTTLTIGGIISSSGSGTLNKSGIGALILNGANTYTGATAINSGTLGIGASERIPDGSAVTVAGGSTFDLQNNNETIGSLTGSGSVTNIGVLDAGGDNTSTTFSGTISGNSLQKSGAGKLTLTGSNSYSGGTSILGGTLSGSTIANQGINSNFGTGNFSIANGATLEYTAVSGSTNRSISLGTGGGTVSVVNLGSLTVSGVIDGSALTKSGPGTLTLRGANTYSGGTIVSDGRLNVSTASGKLGIGNVTVQGTATNTVLAILGGVSNAIDDTATLSLLGGGNQDEADQGYAELGAGINEAIDSLLLGGSLQANGITYGSTASSALFQSDEYFAGNGLVSVGLLGDFNKDNSVDAGDYVVWSKSPGTFGGSPGYDLWRSNFGNTSPATGSGSSLDGGAVPEPASALLAIVTAGWICTATRRRSRLGRCA